MVENVYKMLHNLIELGNCIHFLNIGFPHFQLVPFFLLVATLKFFNNSCICFHTRFILQSGRMATISGHVKIGWFTTFGHQFDYPPPLLT